MSSGSPSKAEGREHVKLSEEPAGREADALAALGSAEGEWEVHLGGDPRQKLVTPNQNVPRTIRAREHVHKEPAPEGQEPAQHRRHVPLMASEHGAATALQQPAVTAAAAAGQLQALQEMPRGQRQEIMKGHDQEVKHVHSREGNYTAEVYKNDPRSMGPGYVKSKNNMIGDSRRAHYGVPQSRKTQQ